MSLAIRLYCLSCTAIFLQGAYAAESIGPTYPIVEPDMIQNIYQVLKEKEKSGELAKLQKEGIDRAKRSAETPAPVKGLGRAQVSRTYYYDPTYRVPADIKGPNGELVARGGDSFNPLDYVVMSRQLLFFDARDSQQVNKASEVITKYDGNVKAILTGGPVLELTRQWKFQVYFDQGGALVRKLGIKNVPALVTQEGKRLRIDEIGL